MGRGSQSTLEDLSRAFAGILFLEVCHAVGDSSLVPEINLDEEPREKQDQDQSFLSKGCIGTSTCDRCCSIEIQNSESYLTNATCIPSVPTITLIAQLDIIPIISIKEDISHRAIVFSSYWLMAKRLVLTCCFQTFSVSALD